MFLNYRNQENVLNRYFILMVVAVFICLSFVSLVKKRVEIAQQ